MAQPTLEISSFGTIIPAVQGNVVITVFFENTTVIGPDGQPMTVRHWRAAANVQSNPGSDTPQDAVQALVAQLRSLADNTPLF